MQSSRWSIVIKKAIADDGSLLFPERLSEDFLTEARKTMGSYIFANQYQNEIIPLDSQSFKPAWIRYYKQIPEVVRRFAFIDPAISDADTADFTAWVIIAVDAQKNWYVEVADHAKLNPSQIIDLAFKIHDKYKCVSIGVEDVAFQKAIIYFIVEEMRRRGSTIPVTGVKRGPKQSKEMRILGLVPRFEWGTISLRNGLYELEKELMQFPRGAHDDIIDALASLESIVSYQSLKGSKDEKPAPNHPDYEKWFIRNIHKERELSESE